MKWYRPTLGGWNWLSLPNIPTHIHTHTHTDKHRCIFFFVCLFFAVACRSKICLIEPLPGLPKEELQKMHFVSSKCTLVLHLFLALLAGPLVSITMFSYHLVVLWFWLASKVLETISLLRSDTESHAWSLVHSVHLAVKASDRRWLPVALAQVSSNSAGSYVSNKLTCVHKTGETVSF